MASVWERKCYFSELGQKVVFLPSLLLCEEFKEDGYPIVLEGVLLLADVSGFTALAEKCVQQCDPARGAEEMVQTLNAYMGDILEEVLAFGGDVLKFAGDAVLVMWRAAGPQLPTAITLALQCCRKVQKKYGTYDTHMGLKLHLKIGISAGMLLFVSVRGGDRRYFFVCSKALDDVINAQKLSAAHEVVLSQTCWELCEQQRIRAKSLAGQGAVKVGGWGGLDPHLGGEAAERLNAATAVTWHSFPPACLQVVGMRRLARHEWKDAVVQLRSARGERHLEVTGFRRPSLRMCGRPELSARLETYLSTSVLRKLREDVPLELCSELRPVTSLFVQLKFADRINAFELSSCLSDCSSMISEIISPHKGEINKTLLFDKGCTFLCVFGFSGEKLARESTHALQCAMQIFRVTSMGRRKLQLVSVAVSSGIAFCGFTGHPERFEHTALGFKVNLAARMMVAYPGMVSCDAETCAASRLPSYCFKELPKRNLKGVTSPTAVYQYLGITKKQQYDMGLAKERSLYGPLLGREAEIHLFECCLEAYEHLGAPHVLAFVGTPGSGKSHLLAELALLGQAAKHRVITVELTEENVKQPFSAIRLLVDRALGLQASVTCSDRQRALQTVLQGAVKESSYCLVNNVFFVEKTLKNPPDSTQNHLFGFFFQVLGGAFGIFFVDNAHFLDSASWSIMWPLLQSVTVLMVMSLAPGHNRAEDIFKAATDSTTSKRITCLRLEGLKASDVVRKACQELGVRSIPRELARFLIQRSSGIPYYCEELLRYLHSNNMLLLHTERPKQGEDNWQSLIGKHPCCPSAVGCGASSPAQPHLVAPLTKHRLSSLFMLPVLYLSSAAKASPAVTAASSPGTGNDSERICAIRPDVSLEAPILPMALKGEE
ncbi:hypothetical protein CIB84_010013, partial [Bambusicola thoracicus]